MIASGSAADVREKARPGRREARRHAIHTVEYSTFPRAHPRIHPTETVCVNRSPSGLCINAQAWEEEGTMLRVVVRDISGRPSLDALARVAWCSQVGADRYRVGLAVVAEGCREPAAKPPEAQIQS